MLDILFFVLVAVATLIFLMVVWPAARDWIVSKTGVVGAALLALATWVGSWWMDSPVDIPPM